MPRRFFPYPDFQTNGDSVSLLLVTYQNQVLSRPGCSIGVSLASFYSQSFFPGTRISAIGINSDGENVLTCRQVAIVVSTLAQACHVLAID